MKERILVGMSGGVDSSVAAQLLQEAGYDVTGMTMRLKPRRMLSEAEAEAVEREAADAAAVCAKLGIDHVTPDFSAEFERLVIEPFIASYKRGETPNPCFLCNQTVKFGLMLDWASAHGFDKIATGHYAQIVCENGRYLLKKSPAKKDQSYFLSLVPAARLQRALFPLADQDKAQSVALVAGAGLRVPLPRESQDICFVPDDEVAYRPFLAAQWRAQGMEPPGAGPVLLVERPEDGAGETREIGRHQGLWRYTEGQRKGLGIAHSEALYVLRKDRVANALIVGPRSLLGMAACVTGPANILVPPEDWPEQVWARLRHRQRAAPARARLDARDRLHITLAAPQFPSAPGQVAALYDADGRVLAGGVVERLE